MSLNLFPARVPVGSVSIPDQDGEPQQYAVMASVEFLRALSDLFQRVGGPNGMSNEDLALIATFSTPPDATIQRSIDDLQLERATDSSAEIACLKSAITDLQTQVDGMASLSASLAALGQKLADVELIASYRDPFRVDWERPGKLGSLTANSVAATTLTASAAVTLSPASANVVISPTGSGLVTINPATTGAMDNVVIGATTARAAKVTTLNGNTITAGTGTLTLGAGKTFTTANTTTITSNDGATLAVGSGGTLGSAAYTSSSAYQAAGSYAQLAGSSSQDFAAQNLTASAGFGCNGKTAQTPVATDGTIAKIETALKGCGIMS